MLALALYFIRPLISEAWLQWLSLGLGIIFIASSAGLNFQRWLQQPSTLIGFSALFALFMCGHFCYFIMPGWLYRRGSQSGHHDLLHQSGDCGPGAI